MARMNPKNRARLVECLVRATCRRLPNLDPRPLRRRAERLISQAPRSTTLHDPFKQSGA